MTFMLSIQHDKGSYFRKRSTTCTHQVLYYGIETADITCITQKKYMHIAIWPEESTA